MKLLKAENLFLFTGDGKAGGGEIWEGGLQYEGISAAGKSICQGHSALNGQK